MLLLFVLVTFSVYYVKLLYKSEKIKNPKTPDEIPIQTPNINYACIIDAGSTSSKEFIYKWKSSNEKNYIPEITPVKNNALKPALAKLKEKLDIETHTRKLLDYCEKEINIISNNTFDIKKNTFLFKSNSGNEIITRK